MARRFGIVVLCLAVYAASAVAAAPCTKTGDEPPAVRTLVASKDKPESDAWIVAPDCSVTVLSAARQEGDKVVLTVNDSSLAIERIDSVPTSISAFTFIGGDLSRGGDFTNAKNLAKLTLDGCSFETFESIRLPDMLTELHSYQGKLKTLKGIQFPKWLTYLEVSSNQLTAIDAELPSQLQHLVLPYNPITSFERVTFPNSIGSLNLMYLDKIKDFKGFRLPSSLVNLYISSSPSIELCESDFALLPNLVQMGAFQSTSCSDPTARVGTFGANSVCVITDARFENRYGATSSSGGTDDNVSTTTAPSSDATADGKQSNPSKTVVILVTIICIVVVIAVAGLGYWWLKKHRSDHDASVYRADVTKAHESEGTQATNAISSNMTTDASEESLENDIRNDESLLQFRLHEQEIELSKFIAQGAFGTIHQATYRGHDVAVKRMLPGKWRDPGLLGQFMDEIRMCAALDHPKIVQFVGITWTSLVDLSVVTEYMGGGDLHDLLYKHSSPSPEAWSQPWTSSQGVEMKPKTLVAQDIVEAIAYLHAFATPVLHRDLKARNVLLTTDGNAKLSDFGISRELVVDKTMTREVGTSAWIAPEVLRGERYSEKADIYSLGVLLVEMDRCGHPYGSRDMQSYHVLVLVSTSELRPEVSSSCPSGIRSLVDRCVSFDASARPTAKEVLFALQVLASL